MAIDPFDPICSQETGIERGRVCRRYLAEFNTATIVFSLAVDAEFVYLDQQESESQVRFSRAQLGSFIEVVESLWRGQSASLGVVVDFNTGDGLIECTRISSAVVIGSDGNRYDETVVTLDISTLKQMMPDLVALRDGGDPLGEASLARLSGTVAETQTLAERFARPRAA